MRTVLQDLKFGVRVLARNPGFTAVAIITLALGIGANTASFSVVNAILLRPLPYPHPNRLMTVWETEPGGPGHLYPVSGPDFVDWPEHNTVFSDVAAGTTTGASLTGGAEPIVISGYAVSPEMFHVLGVQTLRGRVFTAGETISGHDHVVILSYGLWQRAFGGNRDIVGHSITLDGQAYDVAGVMPRGFRFPPGVASGRRILEAAQFARSKMEDKPRQPLALCDWAPEAWRHDRGRALDDGNALAASRTPIP